MMWFTNKKTIHLSLINFNQYGNILKEDDQIRTYLNSIAKANSISNVLINRNGVNDQIQLKIETGKPGILIGELGKGLETLLANIKKILPTMIENINKLLFLDIETVGLYYDLDDLHHQSPQLHKVWEYSGYEYFKRHKIGN